MSWPLFDARSFFSKNSSASEVYYSTVIEGTHEENYIDGVFRFWIPPKQAELKGILTIILGDNMDGLNLVEDAGWQDLASNLNFALLTIRYDGWNGVDDWYKQEQGSGHALITAINQLSIITNRPQLGRVPLVLVGVSTGGQFAYHWAGAHSERMICFITLKGGHHDLAFNSSAATIPGLLVTAQKDMPFRIQNITKLFQEHRSHGAPWTLLVEPNAGHECDKVSSVLAPYIRSIITYKQSADSLNNINSTGGLVADNQSDTLLKNDEAPSNLSETSFIPNEAFYQCWRDIQLGNEAKLQTISLVSKKDETDGLTSVSRAQFSDYVWNSTPSRLAIQVSTPPSYSEKILIRFVNSDSAWHAKLLKEENGKSTYQVSFSAPDGMPLGLYSDVLRFRYYHPDGESLPIVLNIPAKIIVRGDAQANPSSLYLGLLKPEDKIKKTIQISSKGGFTPNILAVELPQELTSAIHIDNSNFKPGQFTIAFDGKDLVNRHYFKLNVKVKTNQIWNLNIPIYFQ